MHADVFRFPPFGSLLCALLGTGAQLLAIIAALLVLAMAKTFLPGSRGAMCARCAASAAPPLPHKCGSPAACADAALPAAARSTRSPP